MRFPSISISIRAMAAQRGYATKAKVPLLLTPKEYMKLPKVSETCSDRVLDLLHLSDGRCTALSELCAQLAALHLSITSPRRSIVSPRRITDDSHRHPHHGHASTHTILECSSLPRVSARSTTWLHGQRERGLTAQSSVVPLDCSWHMPNSDRSALAEYLAGPRLPHARRFDLDEIAELEPDKNPLGLTHMIPSKDKFKEECGEWLQVLRRGGGRTHGHGWPPVDSVGGTWGAGSRRIGPGGRGQL
jgi:hypothetical protein